MTIGVTTSATFERDVLQAKGPVLVDFWASWCAPCRALVPVLERIQEESPHKIRILKVDVDDNSDLAIEYQITSLPSMIVFLNGEIEQAIIGAKSQSFLEETIALYLR